MKTYKICHSQGYEKVNADYYNTNQDNELDLIRIDDEGHEEFVATFKDWIYVKEI